MKTTDKAEKARALAYKKPLVQNLNYEYISEQLYEISEECEEVRWYEDDEETILNALEGDEDEAYQFKMMFSDLSADAERMCEQLRYDTCIPDYFNDFFVFMDCADSMGGLMGWDSYEEDYIKLDWEDFAVKESGKKLMRMTKEEILNTARQCFKVFVGYQSIQSRYDDLKCAFDVLREKNTRYLKLIKDLDRLYEKAVEDPYSDECRQFDNIADSLPAETWLV